MDVGNEEVPLSQIPSSVPVYCYVLWTFGPRCSMHYAMIAYSRIT